MARRRVKFTFPTKLITEPVIYELGHRYKVVTNIRRADVREEMGWVVLELEGAEDEITNGHRMGHEHRRPCRLGQRRCHRGLSGQSLSPM